ncbi:MAG: hypothetical protein SGILL_002884 [Bacillariaceae sp.]
MVNTKNAKRITKLKLRTRSFLFVIAAAFAVYLYFMVGVVLRVQHHPDGSSIETYTDSAIASNQNVPVPLPPPPQSSDKIEAFATKNNTRSEKDDAKEKWLLATVKKAQKEATRKRPVRPNFRANPFGHMVEPHILLGSETKGEETNEVHRIIPEDQVLTAYLEPIDRTSWETKPLPIRRIVNDQLKVVRYPRLNSCQKLPEQWPVDDYPDGDPFLPWIHDVFPTEDGTAIQFVAQNKQRCHTGSTEEEEAILNHTMPQVSLFQHVPLKRTESSTPTNPRFRLSSHEDADPESISTRFICRFKPSGDITFSEFNNDYEWVSRRKGQKRMFQPDGRNNQQVHTSQLLFKCPVPEHLVEQIKTGSSVMDDWATIFIDLIPVRTPPRFGPPDEFLTPRYAKSLGDRYRPSFYPNEEWGNDHILPPLVNSGRWENIPVCKPSLMTYEPSALKGPSAKESVKRHLVSCLWASTGYTTRGNRYAINDGQRRMLEWITFNKMLGFDHFYIYDNSAAFTNASSLQPLEDM